MSTPLTQQAQARLRTEHPVRGLAEELIVDYFRQAIAQAPADGTLGGVAAARNGAVTEMTASCLVWDTAGMAILCP